MSDGIERKLYALAILAIVSLVAVNTLSPNRAFTIAQPSGGTESRTISVSGTGKVNARPDEAQLFLSVETRGPNAADAQQQNAFIMNRVLDKLTTAGVPDSSVETTSYALFPIYEPSRDDKIPRIVGYAVRHSFKVTVSKVTDVGGILDLTVSAGVNSVQGIYFTLSKSKAADLRTQAIQLAAKDAEAKARTLASALGVTITGPTLVSMGFGVEPVKLDSRQITIGTPIIPGDVQVSVTIQVTYAFQ